MRYQFIVQHPVSDEIALQLPDMCVTSYPTGGTAVFGPVRDEADVWSLALRRGRPSTARLKTKTTTRDDNLRGQGPDSGSTDRQAPPTPTTRLLDEVTHS